MTGLITGGVGMDAQEKAKPFSHRWGPFFLGLLWCYPWLTLLWYVYLSRKYVAKLFWKEGWPLQPLCLLLRTNSLVNTGLPLPNRPSHLNWWCQWRVSRSCKEMGMDDCDPQECLRLMAWEGPWKVPSLQIVCWKAEGAGRAGSPAPWVHICSWPWLTALWRGRPVGQGPSGEMFTCSTRPSPASGCLIASLPAGQVSESTEHPCPLSTPPSPQPWQLWRPE